MSGGADCLCRNGHVLTDATMSTDCRGYRVCLACRAGRKRRAYWRGGHEGHDRITRSDGRPYCLTCARGWGEVDDVAVRRAVEGDPPPGLSAAERALAVTRLRASGLPYAGIAARVGCHPGTVLRICHRQGLRRRAEP